MLNRGSQWQRSFSWGVPAFVPLKCQRPDRGPPTQESLQQRNQVPEQLEGRPRASSVAAPNWYSFVVMKVQAWEGNNPRLVLEESL